MIHFIPPLFLAGLLMLAAPSRSSGEDAPGIPTFAIAGYRVEGNTLLPPERLRELLAPFTGSGRDFGTVQQALEALQEEYRSRGYATVHVLLPEQELEQGEVRFKVVEGRLKTVHIEGNAHFDEGNIRRSVPRLTEGLVPDIDSVSASLAVANENPAKKMTLQLQSTEREDELAARVQVVDERPWRVGLTVDNTGSPQTGDWRLGALFQHANLFNRDHILTFQYLTSPDRPSRVGLYSAGYRIPLYSWGDSIDFFGGYSDVDSGTVTSGVYSFLVSGRGIISGIRYNQNLKRHGAWDHRLVYGFDYRIYENNIDLYGIPRGSTVAVHPLSLTYAGDWNSDGISLSAYVTGVQNVPGGEDGETAAFASANSGPADYRILRYGGSFGMALPADWQERLLFNGQYTDNRLVPGEQFGLGGAVSVRGFPERDVASDWGHSANQELYSPDLCRVFDVVRAAQCRMLGFFDVGHVVRVRPVAGDPGDSLIAGGGVGLRVAVGKQFTLAVDYAVVALGGGTRDQGDDRVHLKATLLF